MIRKTIIGKDERNLMFKLAQLVGATTPKGLATSTQILLTILFFLVLSMGNIAIAAFEYPADCDDKGGIYECTKAEARYIPPFQPSLSFDNGTDACAANVSNYLDNGQCRPLGACYLNAEFAVNPTWGNGCWYDAYWGYSWGQEDRGRIFYQNWAHIQYDCPDGPYISFRDEEDISNDFYGQVWCMKSCTADQIKINGICEEPTSCKGEKDNTTGNPCDVASGDKYHTESLNIQTSLDFPLSYSTRFGGDAGLGIGWNSRRLNKLSIADDRIGISRGRHMELWNTSNGVWVTDADTEYLLQATVNGFEIKLNDGGIETYSALGYLLTETDPSGKTTNYSYDNDNKLIEIEGPFGKKLQFEYDTNKHIKAVINGEGARYKFGYDTNNNLMSITYPDITADETDDPARHFHYENPDFPNHLTGITDENDNRFATYAYDENGRAISTEHAQTTGAVGQKKFELDFQGQ